MANHSADWKPLAKSIIVELVRQAGGRLENKTNLFKAFWRAHQHYAQHHLAYLSPWPIVRMPRGPGIDRFDVLLGELMIEGSIGTSEVQKGGSKAICFEVHEPVPSQLTDEQIDSIKFGVRAVAGKSANRVSAESHDDSRSWGVQSNGDEIDVVLDLIPDDEFTERKVGLEALSEKLNAILGEC